MKQYTAARRVKTDTKDLMGMIKLIQKHRAKSKKSIKKFISKLRAALYDLEREL